MYALHLSVVQTHAAATKDPDLRGARKPRRGASPSASPSLEVDVLDRVLSHTAAVAREHAGILFNSCRGASQRTSSTQARRCDGREDQAG